MNIGILTQPIRHNYGGILQAYALQTILLKLGCESKILEASRDILEANYMEEVLNGNYVEGTNYRSIVKHEMGHVVSNIYGLDGGEIAMKITGKNMKETLEYLRKELSGYSAIVPTGDEIISEVFSDYYSNESPKKFSLKFMEECANIIAEKGGDLDVGSD